MHVSGPAGSFTLADPQGKLRAVHGTPLPKTGVTEDLKVRRLRNGTFALDHPVPAGQPTVGPATLLGVVTSTDAVSGSYVLSARGVSLRVSATPGLVPLLLGDRLEVIADLLPPLSDGKPTVVRERSRRLLGHETGPLFVEAEVKEARPEDHVLVFSADDAQENADTFEVRCPAPFKLDGFAPDEAVAALLKIDADGTRTLVGIAADTGPDTADDPAESQGQLDSPARQNKPSRGHLAHRRSSL